MTPKTQRTATIQAAILIAAACISFIVGGVLFCLSIGAGISNEGYAEATENASRINQTWLIVSLVFTSISILLFWVGIYRLANVTDNTRQTASIPREQPTV